MALELGLRTLLLARPQVRALIPDKTVGNNRFPCVFVEHAPQGVTPPFILIHLIAFDPMKALDGTSGMTRTEVDIDCYSVNVAGAHAIARQVEAYLKDYTGSAGTDDTINSVLWNGKRFDRVRFIDGRDVVQNIVSLSFEIFSTAV